MMVVVSVMENRNRGERVRWVVNLKVMMRNLGTMNLLPYCDNYIDLWPIK